jgi:hypothetical protein
MNRVLSLCRVATIILMWAVVVHQAAADPPLYLHDYHFIPSKTTVHVTGGPSDYNLNLTIAGVFGLVTGYNEELDPTAQVPTLEPYAQFVDVHGILYNPQSAAPLPLPGWDLDKTLNMSGWTGTFSADDPNQLFFLGADGQGVAMRVEADINGGWLHLTGGSSDPVGSHPVLYQINALAHLAPFPDFNGDGVITTADVVSMQQALTAPQVFESQHYLSSDDFTALGDINGDGQVTNADLQALLDYLKAGGGSTNPVPEPASWILATVALAIVAGTRFCVSCVR